MANDEWKDIEPYGFARPPWDGETYEIRTRSGESFEAYYDDPELEVDRKGRMKITFPPDNAVWKRVDGQEMPSNDPPNEWRHRRIDNSGA